MKSIQLLALLAIASLTAACQSTSRISSAPEVTSAQLNGSGLATKGAPKNTSNSSLQTMQVADDSSFVSSASSPREAGLAKSKPVIQATANLASVAKVRKPTLSVAEGGRDNPFALAEQPEFEVRFLDAKAAVKSLPPVPNVGLGPEPSASLTPIAPVAVSAQIAPATPTVIIPPAAQPLAAVAPRQLAPVSGEITDLSPMAVPAAVLPAVSPTALAESVEITGIVQLGDQVAIIVRDGEGALSRTVQPGARLAGGQVELRRIETTTVEPQVVLVQNGVEIVRGIGV